MPNAIAYQSPDLNGFSAALSNSADAVASTAVEDNRQRTDSIGLVVHPRASCMWRMATRATASNSIADGGQPAETGQRLAVSYNFGVAKVAALLQDLKDLGGTLGGTSVNRKLDARRRLYDR